MALPSFTFTGNLFDLLGNVDGSEISPNPLGAGRRQKVTFTPNVPINQLVVFDGASYRVKPVEAEVLADGSIKRNGETVLLLANDEGLNVEGLQWRVDVAGMTAWFDAPEDGQSVDLKDVIDEATAAKQATSQSSLDAAVGAYVEANRSEFAVHWQRITEGPDAGLYQGVDGTGALVGDPVELSEIVNVSWETVTDKPGELVLNAKDHGVVGDGVTDDTDAINAALTAVKSAGGGGVFLPIGTYLISSQLVMTGNNVTLQGAGRTATVIKTVGNHAVIFADDASGLCIRDLTVQGDGDAEKTTQMGIRTEDVSDSLIHNVHVKDIGYDGICLLKNSVRNIVSNCLVENCQDDGINVGGNTGTGSTDNVVAGNTIHSCGHTGIHLSSDSSFSSVVGNTVYNCNKGIDTHQPAELAGLGNHVISGNTIRDCVAYGVEVFNADNCIVIGNNISGTQRGLKGTNTSNTQFVGNRVNSTSVLGFHADGDCSDITLADNAFTGESAGVSVMAPRSVINGNRVIGVTTTAYSIQCSSGATDTIVSNNVISGGSVIGINVLGGQVVVSGNRILDGTVGIVVDGDDVLVASNYISGTSSHGIRVIGDDCLITGNTMLSVGNHGVWVDAATRAQIVGNHFRGAGGWSINILGGIDTYVADNVDNSPTSGSLQANSASSGTLLANNRFSSTITLNDTTAFRRDIQNPAGSASLNFGEVAAQSYADLTITVTGAVAGDSVSLGVPTAAVTAGIAYTAWVSASNTVTVRAHNYTAGALDPASGTFKAVVVR